VESVKRRDQIEPQDLPPIKAVYDDELADFLRSLGILDDFENGKIRCKICGDVVDTENLLAVLPDGNQISVTCDKADCQKALSELDSAE